MAAPQAAAGLWNRVTMTETFDADLFATATYRVLKEYFDITLYRPSERQVIFWGNPMLHQRGWKRALNRRLGEVNARVQIERDHDRYRIVVSPLPHTIGRPPLIHLLLFALTFLTVLLAAAFREKGAAILTDPRLLLSGLPFTLTLLFILLVHEMGLFVAGHRRCVIMSYPYFIPAPTFLGTFGALIRTRSPIRTRNDLILIGAAGPLAGAVPSLIALGWGYATSTMGPLPPGPVMMLGYSLITWVLQALLFGAAPNGFAVQLSSIALAGQVGLLVTMLNLLPLGQLDGGHIIYGLFQRRQRMLAVMFLIFLGGLGFFWNGWWIWLALALLMRPYHPPVIDETIPLDPVHRKIGWIAIGLFVLTFVPRPIY